MCKIAKMVLFAQKNCSISFKYLVFTLKMLNLDKNNILRLKIVLNFKITGLQELLFTQIELPPIVQSANTATLR